MAGSSFEGLARLCVQFTLARLGNHNLTKSRRAEPTSHTAVLKFACEDHTFFELSSRAEATSSPRREPLPSKAGSLAL